MAHLRERFIFKHLLKRLGLWPVMGILGPRQVGKSTLIRALCPGERYVNFDVKQLRDEAQKSPDYFVAQWRSEDQLVAFDEAQKVPEIFDAIKASVDENRRPGTFILAGSTQFSAKTGIRESLTGRIGLTRIWPLTLAESCQKKTWPEAVLRRTPAQTSSPAEVRRRIEAGGMPGVCFLRDKSEREELISGWLETSVYRDMEQIQGLNVRGEKVMLVLRALAKEPSLTPSDVAKQVSVSIPTARKILEALEILFIVSRVPAHKLGVGKDRWLICDSAIAGYLGADKRLMSQITFHQEILSQYSFAGEEVPVISYYKTRRGSFIDFIIEDKKGILAVLIVDSVSPKPYELRAIQLFSEKNKEVIPWVLGPFTDLSGRRIKMVPWTMVL